MFCQRSFAGVGRGVRIVGDFAAGRVGQDGDRLSEHALQVLATINRLDTPKDISATFHAFVLAYGFVGALCAILPRGTRKLSDVLLMNTLPHEWTRRYIGNGFGRHDPILAELRHRNGPFLWSQIAARRRLSAHEQAVIDHANAFHIVDGLFVPIRESGRRMGLVTIAARKPIDLGATDISAMTLAALACHTKLVLMRRRAPMAAGHLTPRKREILLMIAEGKSDWHVGKLLTISAKTVNYHVENANRKLGVGTRMQAAVALARGDEV